MDAFAPGYSFIYFFQTNLPALAADGVRDKNHPAIQTGNAHTLGGITFNLQLVKRILTPIGHKSDITLLNMIENIKSIA